MLAITATAADGTTATTHLDLASEGSNVVVQPLALYDLARYDEAKYD